MSPHVSVVIRTYNRAAFLREAIESVLAQTLSDFELIVVDDGSTDATHAVLAAHVHRLAPIVRAHTGNPAATLKAGVRATRGEWIALLDDDDLWLPHKLEQQLCLLHANPCAAFAYGNVRLLYPDGQLSPPALSPERLVNGSLLHALVRDMCVHPSTLIFQRDCLSHVALPDEAQPVAETYLFSLQLARLSEAACVREPIALIRQHDARLSAERGLANYQAAVRALETLLADQTLERRVRWEAHRSIARFRTHIAKQLCELGKVDAARAEVLQALRHDPLHRPAWRWAVRTLVRAHA